MIKVEKWPFKENEEVTVYWVTSPIIQQSTKICDVFFRVGCEEPPKLEPLSFPWGAIPNVWIGQRWKNCHAIGEKLDGNEVKIPIGMIRNETVTDAAKAIPKGLYALNGIGKICAEQVVVFSFEDIKYIVPCIEIARAIYMRNTRLANQFVSSGGLGELIDLASWKLDGRMLRFDFSQAAGKPITKEFARIFAVLYSVEALRNGWDEAYIAYQSRDVFKKISVRIPKINGASLRCRFIPLRNDVRLVSHISCFALESVPFDAIEYGPESIEREQGGKQTPEATLITDDPADVILGGAEQTAKYGSANHAEELEDGVVVRQSIQVKRRSQKDGHPANANRTRRTVENAVCSANEQVGNGELPPVNIEMGREYGSARKEKEELRAEEGFDEFYKALCALDEGWSGASVRSLNYGKVPSKKGFSVVFNRQRKYAYAEVVVHNMRWTILELELQDGYSLSTLLVADDEKSGKEIAEKMVRNLLDNNGHWTGLPRSKRIRRLEHRTGRNAGRWAELMYAKMRL